MADRITSRARHAARLLAVGVLLASLLGTFLLTRSMRAAEQADAEAALELRAREIESLVRQRMLASEQVLRGGRGLFAASESVSRQAFHDYVAAQRVWESYPGIQGVGFSVLVPAAKLDAHVASLRLEAPSYRLWPEGVRDAYSSIIFLEPFEGRNLRAFGFDMFSEPVRRAAMERARDTGDTALSGRVRLVQETAEDVQEGTLLYLPVYAKGLPLQTVEERRVALVGWVYAPFRMQDLMVGVLGPSASSARIAVFDGEGTAPESLLFDSAPQLPLSSEGSRLRRLDIAGARWTLAVSPPPGTRTSSGLALVVISGVSLSALLALLVLTLGTARARALEGEQAAREALAERQRVAATLAAAHRFAQSTLDAFPAQVCVLDEAGVILSVNRAWRGLGEAHGCSAAEGESYLAECERAAGRGDLDAKRFLAALRDLLPGRRSEFVLEVRSPTPGEQRWTLLHATRFEHEGAARVLISHSDVTERHRAEEQRRLAEEQLVAASRLASVGTLAAGVAHEINNPLAWTISSLNLGLEELRGEQPVDRAELVTLLTEAVEGTERIANIVRAMRALGQPERTDPPRPTDVRSELVQATQMVRNELQQRARFELELPERLPPVLAREGDLGRAFLNILLNAVQAISPGQPERNVVRCEAKARGDRIVVTVSDTGPGIGPGILTRIFDPFFTTRPVGQGTGMGLSIARSIVDAAGGGIEVESQPGQGARFTVVLPVATVVAPRPQRSLASHPRRRVLVVDDEPKVAHALVRSLERWHNVTTLTTITEAIARLEQGERWEVLLIDLMMPGTDGIDFYELLRAQHPELLPRLAFITGGAFGDRATAFLSTHDVEVLVKPVDTDRLLEMVDALGEA